MSNNISNTTTNIATEQMTRLGQQIEHESFAVVDQEAGEHAYSAGEWPVVRRMIHATADFEFNGLTKFHTTAIQTGVNAILQGKALIADVEMICVGVSKPRLAHFGVTLHQFISDDDVIRDAKAADSTRAVFSMRKAQNQGLLDGAIIGIGNAPTALLEVIRMIREDGVRPALIIGMPVGFVSAAESKDLLSTINEVPWIITQGRKGGSTLVVAAIHALLALAEQTQKHG
jgi:precorrin-8X/cobalt-precorrin-8 methylmutase